MQYKEGKYCNYCGIKLDEYDLNNDFSIKKLIGYGSRHDGEVLNIHFCTDCMDRIISKCAIPPINGSWNV